MHRVHFYQRGEIVVRSNVHVFKLGGSGGMLPHEIYDY